MKILIVEDELGSRRTLEVLLGPLGTCHAYADGAEAVEAVRRALAQSAPYDVICLDIQMGQMDGHEALKLIRKAEAAAGLPYGRGARVLMTTAKSDTVSVMSAFHGMCDAYLVKPVTRARLYDALRELGIESLARAG